jgi:hypothetical protein
MDRQTTDSVRESYNKIADACVRRYTDELQHKPLDRELLSRFAVSVKGQGEVCDLEVLPTPCRVVQKGGVCPQSFTRHDAYPVCRSPEPGELRILRLNSNAVCSRNRAAIDSENLGANRPEGHGHDVQRRPIRRLTGEPVRFVPPG